MSTNHVAIWIDHKEAHILYFDATKNEIVKAHSEHPHLHHKAHEVGSGNAPPEKHYFHTVINAVADVNEILIVGPGSLIFVYTPVDSSSKVMLLRVSPPTSMKCRSNPSSASPT